MAYAVLKLHDWKSHEHHGSLKEMVISFLDGGENGQLFWPDDERAPNANKLKYSQHNTTVKLL
ncbi:hypothetical protein HD806DRAFT_550948, partial [Xylariaceae sp. AK1471]